MDREASSSRPAPNVRKAVAGTRQTRIEKGMKAIDAALTILSIEETQIRVDDLIVKPVRMLQPLQVVATQTDTSVSDVRENPVPIRR